MPYHYAILGSGRQGTAAAYDLAVHGDAEAILLADLHGDAAARSATRVNRLAGREVATAAALDVRDTDAVVDLLRANRVDAFISGVPYFFNLPLARAAVRAQPPPAPECQPTVRPGGRSSACRVPRAAR